MQGIVLKRHRVAVLFLIDPNPNRSHRVSSAVPLGSDPNLVPGLALLGSGRRLLHAAELHTVATPWRRVNSFPGT